MTADLSQLPKDATKQLGSALSPYQLYQAVDPTTGDWYDYGSQLAARDIDEMLGADGRARAVEQALTLPLRAAPFTLKPAHGDSGEFEMISESLERMTIPLQTVIGQAAQSLIYRATYLEKIFTVERGLVEYDALAWRPPDVCAMTRNQGSGAVTGFRQTVWGATDAVRIPAAKAVVFLHGANRDPVRGVSEMQVSYRCFRDKQKLRLLWMIMLERAAAPWIIARTNSGEQDETARTLTSMRSGGVAAVSGVDGVDVLNVSGDAAQVFQSAVQFLDAEMAGSVLAGFLDLASAASRGAGSLALSQDQTDFYQASMDAAAREIATQAREQIIAPLVRYNFGPDGVVPDVTLGPIGGATTEQMLQLVQSFAGAPAGQSVFPKEFVDEIVLRISGALDLDVDKIAAAIKAASEAPVPPAAQPSQPLHAAVTTLDKASAAPAEFRSHKVIGLAGDTDPAAVDLASAGGHHIPGTATHWRHGWIKADGLPEATVKDLRGGEKPGSAVPHLVTDANGATHFTPERAALHQRLVNEILGRHATHDKPAFVMLGGGAASGKTKLAEAAARDFPDAVTINPATGKAMLPEHNPNDRQSSAFTHEESSYVAKLALAEGLRRKHHVILDGVGNSSLEKVMSKIKQAKAAGYETHARYVTVHTDEAVRRAEARAQRTGRSVPEKELRKGHAGVSTVFPQALEHFDTAELHDNNVETKKILSKHDGKVTVHDRRLYRRFLAKADASS